MMKGPLRIVIPGGSGQVGTVLSRHFHGMGHDVVVLARGAQSAPWRVVPWDGSNPGVWIAELEDADVVINLAGRSVNCRYSPENRRAILDSRIKTTELLGRVINQLSRPPRLWMNASTATIYRHIYDRPMDEESGEIGGSESDAPERWRFSIKVATEWEKTFFEASTPKTRKVALRSAIMMNPDRGSVFDLLLRLVRFGLGGTSGSGRQFVSWIHDADFLASIEFLIAEEEFSGVVNLASPSPLPNGEFMRALRRAWGAPIGLPASAWMLEIGSIFLRTETELVLKSRRVVPKRLLDAGFQFRFPEWSNAACDLVERWRSQTS